MNVSYRMFDTLAFGLGDNLDAICKLKIIVNIFASNLIYKMLKKLMFHRYYNYTQLFSKSFNIMLPRYNYSQEIRAYWRSQRRTR